MFSILFRQITYTAEKHTAIIRDRTITIENMVPQLTEQERFEQYQEIESGLFDIFIKYEEHKNKSDSYLRVAAV